MTLRSIGERIGLALDRFRHDYPDGLLDVPLTDFLIVGVVLALFMAVLAVPVLAVEAFFEYRRQKKLESAVTER